MDPKFLDRRKLLSVKPGCDFLRGKGPFAYVTLPMCELIALSSFSAVTLPPQFPSAAVRIAVIV